MLSAIGLAVLGEVWKLPDIGLGRIVAIKEVNEQHSDPDSEELS